MFPVRADMGYRASSASIFRSTSREDSDMTAATAGGRSDTLVIGLVGTAHMLSHFYQIALAPLFPLLKAEFNVSYTQLGLIVSLFFIVSGSCQAFVGILVDRYGAHRLLLFGITTMAISVLLMGFAPAYWVLLPLSVLAALGNCVFHPADISILSAKVSPHRIGRAFGIHGFGGNLGYFISPLVIFYGVASFAGWRAGLVTAGAIGLVAAYLIYRYRDVLRMPPSEEAQGAAMPGIAFYLRLVTNLPLMAAFSYFALVAAALIGIQNYSASALVEIYDPPLFLATAGLTAFLAGSAAGILTGGELADRFRHHATIAIGGLVLAAAFTACVAALPLPMWAIIALLAAAGFCAGATNPSRDVMVRNATPPGATGKVFGFVYSGLDLGAMLAPLVFGWLMDSGQYRAVFVVIAALYLFSVLSVLQLSRGSQPASAPAE
jgi:MFS family permease